MLSRIHITAAVLHLLNLFLILFFRISFRGILAEQVIVLVLFISALLWLLVGRNNLKKGRKIYLFLYPVYLFIALALYMTRMIAFILLLAPFGFFFLPQRTIVNSGKYEIREHAGVLAPPGIVLYKKYFLFEKDLGYSRIAYDKLEDKWSMLKTPQPNGNKMNASLKINGQDTLLTFQ